MTLNRRHFHTSLLAAAASGLVASGSAQAQDKQGGHGRSKGRHNMLKDKLFSSSNAAAGNTVLVYAGDDELTMLAEVPTGGHGSGNGLGSQGALALSEDGRWLFVVNAGDHTLSTFALGRRGLELAAVTPSGGLRPISVSERAGIVYVLNAGSSNVSGFRLRHGGLHAIPGSNQFLSSAGNVGPAQVAISTDGDLLVVTEKGTNLVTYFALDAHGVAGPPASLPSPGDTPFGFSFDRRNRFFVSEAFGGASGASTLSSYRIGGGTPVVVSAAIPSGQGAACWVSISPNGRYAYTANTASSTVSQYQIDRRGAVTLVAGAAGSTGPGTAPIDMAMPPNGRLLHVLAGGASPSISSFEVGAQGSLSVAVPALVVAAGSVGLAAN